MHLKTPENLIRFKINFIKESDSDISQVVLHIWCYTCNKPVVNYYIGGRSGIFYQICYLQGPHTNTVVNESIKS